MKHAALLITLRLVGSAASPPAAFVNPAATAAASPAFTTNRPELGDVSSPIAPQGSLQKQRHQQQHEQHSAHGQRNIVVASLGGSATSVAGVLASSTPSVVSWLPTALATIVGVLAGASLVNALQGGVRGDLGLTPEQILGVPAEEATAEDVSRLGTWCLLAGSLVMSHEVFRVCA